MSQGAVSLLTLVLLAPGGRGATAPPDFSPFTSEVLPVFYVRDVERSVVFYTQKLGFRLSHFHDYEQGESVPEWNRSAPAIYAELRAGNQRLALHRSSRPEELRVSGLRHYFGVVDVKRHHRAVKGRGVETSDLIDRPWMLMFRVTDPDGHPLYFFTRPGESEEK